MQLISIQVVLNHGGRAWVSSFVHLWETFLGSCRNFTVLSSFLSRTFDTPWKLLEPHFCSFNWKTAKETPDTAEFIYIPKIKTLELTTCWHVEEWHFVYWWKVVLQDPKPKYDCNRGTFIFKAFYFKMNICEIYFLASKSLILIH